PLHQHRKVLRYQARGCVGGTRALRDYVSAQLTVNRFTICYDNRILWLFLCGHSRRETGVRAVESVQNGRSCVRRHSAGQLRRKRCGGGGPGRTCQGASNLARKNLGGAGFAALRSARVLWPDLVNREGAGRKIRR